MQPHLFSPEAALLLFAATQWFHLQTSAKYLDDGEKEFWQSGSQ
jgi:hypothetical protein